MMQALLFFWIASAALIIREQRVVRNIIYLGVFSYISSACFLLLAAPDIAIAEAAISTYATIFFIACFEKYYGLADGERNPSNRHIAPIVFTVFLCALFIFFMPRGGANAFLKDRYTSMFSGDVGGENAVTAIYLGYRIYDTLFEALMLLVSVVAVAHLSWYGETHAREGKRLGLNRSAIASFTIRMICPLIFLFGAYLTVNGHFTPGGGFQGGVAIASFFICRYMIYDIYDIRVGRVITTEKLIYAAIVLLPAVFIFLGLYRYFPRAKNMYLIAMNTLIGIKVTLGFFILFYRYIAFESR